MSSSVSVVIVTYNGCDYLAPCLQSLVSGSRIPEEIIVVDNASTDGTVSWLSDTYPCVMVIPCVANLGFAQANNIGITRAQGNLIFTLNNDTELAPDALAHLVSTMDGADLSVGAVMSTMVFRERPEIIASAGLEVFTNGLVRDVSLGERVNRSRLPYPVFGPSTGAALYRRTALDDVGLFDPAFFMYLEDADLAWRLRLREWETVSVPDAIVRHAVSATAGYGSPRKAYYLARNRWWCLLKNLPSALLRKYARQIALYDAAAIGFALVAGERASVIGRCDIFRDFATIRAARSRIQSRATASDDEIEAWLQPAPPLVMTLRERKMIQRLLAT